MTPGQAHAAGEGATPGGVHPLWIAVGAYVLWGLLPLYFKAVGAVPPLEIVAHRVLWSVALLLVIVALRRRLPELREALTTRRMLVPMMATAALIAVNWLVYIWAVANGRIAAASLGYYLNPLVNVLLAALFLGERLTRLQWLAVGIAGAGVAVLASSSFDTLWIGVVLAVSFGLYGLIRKVAALGPMVGLATETILLAPIAAAWLAWWTATGHGRFGAGDLRLDALLIVSGAVTALPLLLFATAARRLSYATIGLVQYIAPSIQLGLAVWLFHEPLTRAHLIAFPLIWLALALYTAELWRNRTRREPVAA